MNPINAAAKASFEKRSQLLGRDPYLGCAPRKWESLAAIEQDLEIEAEIAAMKAFFENVNTSFFAGEEK